MPELTPMVRQYLQVKEKYKDSILFYRLGDFYEMFFDDAEKVSKLLNLTLTSRNKNQADSIPLCGVPHHSAQGYINKLVSLGHKVAICEQIEDPKFAKGIVKREVVQVISPGLVLDPDSLQGKSSRYLLSIYFEEGVWGLSYIDISTGVFKLTDVNSQKALLDEVGRLDPSEILIHEGQRKEEWGSLLEKLFSRVRFNSLDASHFGKEYVYDLYRSYYQTATDGLGVTEHPAAMTAGGAILSYLSDTKLLCEKIVSRPQFYSMADYLILDTNTKRNLELVETISERAEKGSLFWLLDAAKTSMGSRLLKNWMLYPLVNVDSINARLDAVEEFKKYPDLLFNVREKLSNISDLERIQNRIVAGLASSRDLVALSQSLRPIEDLRLDLQGSLSLLTKDILAELDPAKELCDDIDRTLVELPPLAFKEGGMVQDGVNAELDELRNVEKNGKYFIATMESRERERTGISSLKIRFNQVFGYSIEVTHAHKAKIPTDYIRKQTLTQAERYITPELKEYEEKVLGAAAKICELELKIFLELRAQAISHSERIKKTARSVAVLDALSALSYLAHENRYVRPTIMDEPLLDIRKGRHPLVEALFREEVFVPNDVLLDTHDHRLMIITGPNMAGKSTVMRQTALIILMAQMGSFVPAESARLGITDRIFTRIGASDHLQKGESTFMVEMLETAQILSQATVRSLIILDEIGRGTSTFDGLSIAWAVAETIHDKIKARTLFATHYHELTDLAGEKSGIQNFHMAIKEWNDKIIFLRELKEGGANRSYGVVVAAMAGLPLETINRAREILKILEQKDLQFQSATKQNGPQTYQPSLFETPTHPIVEEIKKLNLNKLTPLEALNFLAVLKTKVE